jgi:hypothetical protein
MFASVLLRVTLMGIIRGNGIQVWTPDSISLPLDAPLRPRWNNCPVAVPSDGWPFQPRSFQSFLWAKLANRWEWIPVLYDCLPPIQLKLRAQLSSQAFYVFLE